LPGECTDTLIGHVNVNVKRKAPNNGTEIQHKWNHYQGLLDLETKSQIHVHLTSLRNLVLGLDYLDQGLSKKFQKDLLKVQIIGSSNLASST
jgi:hypothetical protein